MKTCISCHLSKPLADFPNYKRYADGKHRYCKACHCKNVERHRRNYGVKAMVPMPERFWMSVQQCAHGVLCPYCCWEWQKARDKNGYGHFTVTPTKTMKQRWRAHRFLYTLWHGIPLPNHLLVCHFCDNPPCCNPLHLWVGTHADNHRDRDQKGRGAWQRQPLTPPRRYGEEHPCAKLTEEKVRAIRTLYSHEISSIKLASVYGVSKPVILSIIHRRIWKHVS